MCEKPTNILSASSSCLCEMNNIFFLLSFVLKLRNDTMLTHVIIGDYVGTNKNATNSYTK